MLEKKRTPISVYLVLGLILLVLSYYLSGLFTYEDLSMKNYQTYLLDIATHFYQVTRWYNEKTISCVGLGVIAWFFLCYYIQYHFRNFQSGKEHGAEEWGDVHEINKRRSNPDPAKNRILTKHLSVDTCGKGKLSNNNMLIVAASGKYKTTSVVTPNLLQATDHYIVLDVKGELQYKYGLYLKSKGYDIRSLNLKTPEKSDRYNPFAYIEKEEDLIRLIENIYESLEPPDAMKNDPFWTDGPKLYMQSLFYYEWFVAKKEGRAGCINNIMSLANEQTQESDRPAKVKGQRPPSKLEVRMETLAKEYGQNNPAVRDYYKFIGGAADTVRSIVIIVNAKLKLLELPALKRIFEDDDMHIRDLATGVGGTVEHPTDKKVAIFLCSDDTDPSLNFVFSMLYTQALNILCRMADIDFRSKGGSLPIPVGFWMDEIYAGARPSNTETALGTIRSRNIYMVPIFQSIAQMKALFPNDKWQIILDNCSFFCFWGAAPSAQETHEFISKLLGDMTFDTISDNKNGLQTGINYAKAGGNLMSPAAVKRMPNKECIVFIEEEYPVYDEKALPWEDKNSPFHTAMKMNKESGEGGYVHPVEVIWDEKANRYITMQEEFQGMYINPDDPEFLYADLTDDGGPASMKDLIKMYQSGETEDVPTVGTVSLDKTEFHEIKRDVTGSLLDIWQRFSSELTDMEKQLILRASDLGMPEENIKQMFNQSVEDMQQAVLIYEKSQSRAGS